MQKVIEFMINRRYLLYTDMLKIYKFVHIKKNMNKQFLLPVVRKASEYVNYLSCISLKDIRIK